jgi:hypothetical protein
MKGILILFLIALATVVPLILIGSAHKDYRVGNSLYVKGLQADRTAEILRSSDINWSLNCAEKCRLEVSILPEPDNGSVEFNIFLPGGAKAEDAWAGTGSRWAADFKKAADGWYDVALDYTYNGVPVNLSKSFYIN